MLTRLGLPWAPRALSWAEGLPQAAAAAPLYPSDLQGCGQSVYTHQLPLQPLGNESSGSRKRILVQPHSLGSGREGADLSDLLILVAIGFSQGA